MRWINSTGRAGRVAIAISIAVGSFSASYAGERSTSINGVSVRSMDNRGRIQWVEILLPDKTNDLQSRTAARAFDAVLTTLAPGMSDADLMVITKGFVGAMVAGVPLQNSSFYFSGMPTSGNGMRIVFAFKRPDGSIPIIPKFKPKN